MANKNSTGICQRAAAAVDKERVLKAVSSLGSNIVCDVPFGKQLSFPGTLKPLKVDKLGEIPIPVSLKVYCTMNFEERA